MIESSVQSTLPRQMYNQSRRFVYIKLCAKIFPWKIFSIRFSATAKVDQPAINRSAVWIIDKAVECSKSRASLPLAVCHAFCIFRVIAIWINRKNCAGKLRRHSFCKPNQQKSRLVRHAFCNLRAVKFFPRLAQLEMNSIAGLGILKPPLDKRRGHI